MKFFFYSVETYIFYIVILRGSILFKLPKPLDTYNNKSYVHVQMYNARANCFLIVWTRNFRNESVWFIPKSLWALLTNKAIKNQHVIYFLTIFSKRNNIVFVYISKFIFTSSRVDCDNRWFASNYMETLNLKSILIICFRPLCAKQM